MARFDLVYSDGIKKEVRTGADSITLARRNAVKLFKEHYEGVWNSIVYIVRSGEVVGVVTYKARIGGVYGLSTVESDNKWWYTSISDKWAIKYRLHPFGNLIGKPVSRDKFGWDRHIRV